MKIFKNLNLLRRALMVLGFVLLLQPLQMRAALQNIEFTSLNNRDGLSNSQVNAILKDKTGYVWFGTQSGLNRFDGFRMKTFLYSATNQTSLANNYVDELQEDNEGKIWVHTSVGYCVYDPTTEQFDRKPEVWLKTINVEGVPQRLLVDSQKNMWIQVWGKGLYYYNVKNETTYLFKYVKKPKSGCLMDGDISSLKDVDGKLLVTYGDGMLCLLDGDKQSALYGVHRSSHADKPTRKNYVAKVLLVDDSDDFREFMRDVLTDYQVIEAVNGKDAWQKIIEVRPDVILSDVMMPVMDGIELCRMVKSNEETASIPFVMLTARLAAEHRVEGLESGADDYITKPFNIDMLNLRIRNLLGWARRSARRSILDKDKEGKKDPSQPKERVIPKGELGDFEMTASDRKFLADVDKYIKDMMGDPDTSVESMSAHLCMSRVQLYKRMVSLTGTTPSEYLRAKRIKRAEELIHSDELNISEIAYTVGFNNPRYFTKYFQEAYGLTPSQYKKKLNGESI